MNRASDLRVMLVEDTAADAELVLDLLGDVPGAALDVHWVDSLSEARRRIEEHWDAILLDLSFPDSRGLETLERVRSWTRAVPIVVLTGLLDDRVGLRAIELGAQDYLRKDQMEGALLARAVRFAVERWRVRVLFESVIESQDDAVVVVDRVGRIVSSNPRAHVMFAGGFAEWQSGLHVDDVPLDEARRPSRTAAAGGTDAFVAHRRDDVGRIRWVDVRVRPLSRAGVEVGGGVVVVRDVTSEVEAQRQIESLNATLRQHLDHQTRLLTRLEASDRLKERFIDAVSHELRTPLTPIKGFSRLLLRSRREPLTPVQRESVNAIHASAVRLENLVESMLDFQALEAATRAPADDPVDVGEVLDQLADDCRSRLGGRPVEVIASAAPSTPARVMADRERLVQALRRVVDNAAQYTDEGRIELIAEWDDGREALCITVADTGIGISAEYLDAIFGAFFQVEPGVAGRSGGVGLGLAHARALIESMNGQIAARSEPGAGARFTRRRRPRRAASRPGGSPVSC